MARFHSVLWTGQDSQRQDKANTGTNANHLLSVTMLWLRSLDGDLGLENLIKLFVPFSNDLHFGTDVPSGPLNYLPVSDGTVLPVSGHGRRIVWVRHWRGVLNLSHYEYVSRQTNIHLDWIEWALGWAIVKLWESGIDWAPKKHKPKTIGGLEVADFSEDLQP